VRSLDLREGLGRRAARRVRGQRHCRFHIRGVVVAIRKHDRIFAAVSHLDVWYDRLTASEIIDRFGGKLSPKGRLVFAKPFADARRKTSLRAVKKLTQRVEGELRFRSVPPLLVPLRELMGPGDARDETDYIRELLNEYAAGLDAERRYLFNTYRFVDMARKVVGVGSVGTRCWIVLMLGRDDADPLFLQVKEAEASVLSRFVGASKYANQGQRVVAGQRLMQASSDIFLGWQRVEAGLDGRQRDFYVRQLRDWKFSADIETMIPRGMRLYGELCGWTLARAHARSGDRIAIASYLGASDVFDRAITEFAAAYADQNERDHQSLVAAVASGRIAAEPDL